MPFIDTNHQRAAILVLVLGVALLIALTPYATGLIGIPVLYAVSVANQPQDIAGGGPQPPTPGRLAQLKTGQTALGPRLAELGAQIVSWIGSSAFGLIGSRRPRSAGPGSRRGRRRTRPGRR